jgi:Fe-S cluster assembly iron-binding protein IscA
MLTLTFAAVEVIRALTDQHGITSEAGVRLAGDEAGTLIASFVPWPEYDDRVIEISGARLFVEADVAPAVDNKALDVTVGHDGEVIFALNDPPGTILGRPAAHPRRGRHRRSRRRS